MSYILEALKRADAERERGAVPGLHAQSIALGEFDDAPRRHAPWLWIVLGFVLGLCALAAGWWWLRPAQGVAPAVQVAAPPAVAKPATSTAPTAPAVPAAPSTNATATPPAAGGAAATATVPKPAAGTTPSAAAPKTAAGPAAKSPQGPAAINAPQAAAAAAPRPTAAAPARPAAPPPAPRVPRLADLSEDMKREIPPLKAGGAMYSENRANRMLILNGQLYREGDQPAPGVTLEQIRPKQAIFVYKGQRFEIGY